MNKHRLGVVASYFCLPLGGMLVSLCDTVLSYFPVSPVQAWSCFLGVYSSVRTLSIASKTCSRVSFPSYICCLILPHPSHPFAPPASALPHWTREKSMQLFFLGLWGARGKEGNSALCSKASSLPAKLALAEVGLEEVTPRKGNTVARIPHSTRLGATIVYLPPGNSLGQKQQNVKLKASLNTIARLHHLETQANSSCRQRTVRGRGVQQTGKVLRHRVRELESSCGCL